jgi:reactive intermediate/imine deaminase
MANHLQTIHPSGFAPSSFPYSNGVKAGNLVFVAGQVALDDQNNIVAAGDVKEQTRVCIDRIRRVLAEVGGSLTDVASATVWLTDMANFAAFNEAWIEAFGDHRPTRATVQSTLARPEFVVEVAAIAVLAS